MTFKVIQTKNHFYKLKFGFAAMEFVEDVLGISISELSTALQNPSMKQIRILLHAMLESGEERTFKTSEVHALMDEITAEKGIEGLAEVIGEVITLAFPDKGRSYPEETGKR